MVRSHDGQTWVRLSRQSPKPAYGEDRPSAIYVDWDALKRGRLNGCSKASHTLWWVAAPDVPGGPELKGLLHRFWECTTNWIDRAAPIIQELIDGLPPSIQVDIDLPGFADWEDRLQAEEHPPAEEPAIGVNREAARLTLTMREGFLAMLHRPENDGEKSLVRSVVRGASELAESYLSDPEVEKAVDRIIPNSDARFFHVYATHDLQEVLGGGRSPEPVFVVEEDLALAHLGLAELAGRPDRRNAVSGRDKSVAFLQDLVAKLWERVEKRLSEFDRSNVVAAGLASLHETSRDAHQWDLATRAMLGLHEGEQGIHTAIQRRRSERARSNLANRAMVETAQ